MAKAATKRQTTTPVLQDVRLFIPNNTSIEVWVNDICTLKMDKVKQIILDNGREKSVVKVA